MGRFIDEFFDVGEVVRRQGGAVEIEGEFFRSDGGSFLGGLLADDFVEGPVEDVGGGVMPFDGSASGAIDE